VLTGRVNPSGRLPVSMPRSAGAQPFTYLHPILGGDSDVTNLASGPARPFGFGLSYTTFAHDQLTAPAEAPTGDPLRVTVRVTNTGDRAGADVVQLYGHDPVASLTRPVAQLLGFRRVLLQPGESAVVDMVVPPARFAFTSREGERIVEPGAVDLWVGGSCADRETETSVTFTGGVHRVGYGDELWTRSSLG
jgi:beta-glucosidase